MIKHTPLDNLIARIDRHFVSVIAGSAREKREYPAENSPESSLNSSDKEQAVAFMRINHAGEVSAQALYLGQAVTTRDKSTRNNLLNAADEERDHLAWCHRRLKELDGRRSFLDPFWFLGSFMFGALAGAMDKKIGLGFVEETEKQVYDHLQDHLHQLNPRDVRTIKIIEQMQLDEQEHGQHAADHGAIELPAPVQTAMKYISKVMTKTAYWL